MGKSFFCLRRMSDKTRRGELSALVRSCQKCSLQVCLEQRSHQYHNLYLTENFWKSMKIRSTPECWAIELFTVKLISHIVCLLRSLTLRRFPQAPCPLSVFSFDNLIEWKEQR